MSRNEQASRILRIINILEQSSEGLRVPEIMTKLNDQGFACTRRTVYRDLEAIQNCGFPVENSDSGAESGTWKLSKLKTFGSKIVVTYEELLALFLARESLKTFEGSSFYASLEAFFNKFESMLGDKSIQSLREFCSTIGFKSKAQWTNNVPKNFIDLLLEACSNGQEVKIQYHAASGATAGEVSSRRLGAECVYFADSGAYFVAKDLDKNEFRIYSLSRIKEVEITGNSYNSEIHNPEDFFKHSLGLMSSGEPVTVKLRVDAPLAMYVAERKWHKSQSTTKDGTSVLITLKVSLNTELVSWILSLGEHATVLEPQSLQERLVHVSDLIKNKYNFKKAA